MSRLKADLLLLLTATIWGTAFVAQKTGMSAVGPFGFAGSRFVFSLMVIMPLVLKERLRKGKLSKTDYPSVILLCLIFTAGVLLQQIGVLYTSVTNAGFLTGLYVVIVPFIVWAVQRVRPQAVVWVASTLALMGVWFLNDAHLESFRIGDFLVIGCAACFAAQVVLLSAMVRRTGRPMLLSALQYAAF